MVALAMMGASAAPASEQDLTLYSFSIFHGQPASAEAVPQSGNAGIYIGNGLVLTAAHVIGGAASAESLGVVVKGEMIPARLGKMGRYEDIDLAILVVLSDSLPSSLRDHASPRLCGENPAVGSAVRIVEPRGETVSTIASADLLPIDLALNFPSLIADAYGTGNSGSAVFDDAQNCLLGIMSRKLDLFAPGHPGQALHSYKYFVPIAAIRDFLRDVPAAQGFLAQ